MKKIWTKTARDLLWEQVVEKFGPYSTWESRSSPGRGLDKAFNKFCEKFADLVEAKSAKAVKHQIQYGMPIVNGASTTNHGGSLCYITNLAAAYEAGFITCNELPSITLVNFE